MRLLCLDLSTKTGWAAGDTAGAPTYGTKEMPSTAEDIGRFAYDFDGWLRAFVALDRPETVVYESPILTAGKTSIATARKLLGLAYHVELICTELAIRCREANIMTIKKNFGGSGRASKEDMMHLARKYGWAPKNDNEADALAIWAYSSQIFAPNDAGRFRLGPIGARR